MPVVVISALSFMPFYFSHSLAVHLKHKGLITIFEYDIQPLKNKKNNIALHVR